MTNRDLTNKRGRPTKDKDQIEFDYKTGQEIRNRMEMYGMKQCELAESVEISPEYLSKLLNGESSMKLYLYMKIMKELDKRNKVVLPDSNDVKERIRVTKTEELFEKVHKDVNDLEKWIKEICIEK